MAFLLVLLLSIASPFASAQRNKPAPLLPGTAVTRAGWLVGCWHMPSDRGNPSVRQVWTRASNDLLIGTSINVPPGLTPEYFFFRMEFNRANGLSLVWQAPGERPLRLAIDSVTRPSRDAADIDAMVFVNPAAGLPKRVEFRHGKSETLVMLALYEGTKALETPMRKVDCPGG